MDISKLEIKDALDEKEKIENSDFIETIQDSFDYYGAPGDEAKDLESYKAHLEKDAKRMSEYNDDKKKTANSNEPIIKEVVYGTGIKYVYCNIDSYNSNPAFFKVTRPDPSVPITNFELLAIYSKAYQYMYEMENNAVGDPGNVPGMLNRAASHGPYAVWGHSIGDLVYNGASIIKVAKDFIYCDFSVDS